MFRAVADPEGSEAQKMFGWNCAQEYIIRGLRFQNFPSGECSRIPLDYKRIRGWL